jgi:replicative DNA helicase Mcm
VDSVAPSVYNNEDAKLALALQLFGGVTKQLPDGDRIRGDIHVLLVGNPASGQARLTRHSARLAPRSMRVSGKTTTQVGLTATAHMSGGKGSPWDVEGGALVLADKGLTAINRLDAMRPEARESLPTVLDEQSVHVAKATITETLNARTSVLAEAAPKYGRFDQYEPIGEQIGLEPDLISQFDLLFIHNDNPERSSDEAQANHIIDVNYSGEVHANRNNSSSPVVDTDAVPETDKEVTPAIDPNLLRRYISYARQNHYPVMTEEAKEVIREFYMDLRSKGYEEDAPIPVTSRKLEAIVRLAEASARIRLSDKIEQEDANRVISLVRRTLESLGVDTETERFDANVVEKGTGKEQRDRMENLKALISGIESEYDEGAPIDEIFDRAEEVGFTRSQAEDIFEKLRGQGDIYMPTDDHWRTV